MKKYVFRFKAWSANFYQGILELEVYARNKEEAKEQFDTFCSYSEYKIESL